MNKQHYSQEEKFWDDKGRSAYLSLSLPDQQRFSKWINWHGNGVVLDVGGGSGMASHLLSSMPNTTCVCIDISLKMLKHSLVPSVQADALLLPFRNDSFDLVVAAAFFHHLPKHEKQLLKEIFRVLKPGGRLVGYDPNAHCLQNRIFMKHTYLRLKTFSPDELPIFPEWLSSQMKEFGIFEFKFNYFSFKNRKLTFFEIIQRYFLTPCACGPLKRYLERWFFWQCNKNIGINIQ